MLSRNERVPCNARPAVRRAVSAMLAALTIAASGALASWPIAAHADATPIFEIPGSPQPSPAPPGGVQDAATAALAAAEIHLQDVTARIAPLAAQVKGLRAVVAKRAAVLTRASDAVDGARSAFVWERALLSGGESATVGGIAHLLETIAVLRTSLRGAEARAAAARVAAAADPSLTELFAATQTLEGLRGDRAATERQIEILLAQTRVTDTGANGSPGARGVPYGSWADLFLRTTGLPECQNNLSVLVAWQVAESTDAAWNPLATTRDAPGATDFNPVGVKDYPSLDVGLTATAQTLWGGYYRYGYGWIVYDLYGCADPMTTAKAINASAWCSGCANGTYVTGVLPQVEANYPAYAGL